ISPRRHGVCTGEEPAIRKGNPTSKSKATEEDGDQKGSRKTEARCGDALHRLLAKVLRSAVLIGSRDLVFLSDHAAMTGPPAHAAFACDGVWVTAITRDHGDSECYN